MVVATGAGVVATGAGVVVFDVFDVFDVVGVGVVDVVTTGGCGDWSEGLGGGVVGFIS